MNRLLIFQITGRPRLINATIFHLGHHSLSFLDKILERKSQDSEWRMIIFTYQCIALKLDDMVEKYDKMTLRIYMPKSVQISIDR